MNIRIHASIDDKTADTMTDIASTIGLDAIDYNANYRMYKIGSKYNGDITLAEKLYVGSGFIRLVGTVNHVALMISSIRDWFRTSPVVSCTKKNNVLILETKNSFYELVED